jgi:putative ABC transport system permease protein
MWTWLSVVASRLMGALNPKRLDRDLEDFDREVTAHLDMMAEDAIRRGLPPDEARRAAAVRFGGHVQLREQQRDERSLPLVETTVQDIRYGLRALARNPGFAAAAVLTLAVGIGANTTMFSVVHAVLLRPLPYARPDELVRVFESNPLKHWTKSVVAPANYADWKTQNTVFEEIAAYEGFGKEGSLASDVFLTGSGEPQSLKALSVSGNLLRMLGVPPLLGRTFVDEETFEGRSRVVVLSYALWQSLLGGDRNVIGRTLTLSGRTYDVVGVMPPAFAFPGRDVQLWMPLAYTPDTFATARRPHWLNVVARLKSGVPIERAREDMTAIAGRLERQYPDTNTQMGVRLETFHESLNGGQRPALMMLFAAVVVLFLIVCANIANLQVGRAVGRAREMSIRHALGARRGRIVRQLLTESLLVSAIGGAGGLTLAAFARMALGRFAPDVVPLFTDLRLDGPVLLFTVLLCLLAPVAFGLLPAVASSRGDRLNDRSDASPRGARSMRDVLVGCEVGLSVVLVVGAVLLVRSLIHLQEVDPGFNQEHVVAFRISLPTVRYGDAAKKFLAFDAIERRLRDSPAVQAVGATSTLVMQGFTWTGDATVEGRDPADYERELRHKSITPGYIRAVGSRLLAGRLLDESDTRERPPVTLVNQTLAARYFRGADPIGKRMTFGRPQDQNPWVTIVGVVADSKQDGLDKPVEPEVYTPLGQMMQNPLTYVVRTSGDVDSTVAWARRSVRAVDKDLPLTGVTTLTGVVQNSMGDERFRTVLLTAFAVVALLLAALGIYGVLAYFVTQRGRELGVRLALGARPRALFLMVVGQGLRPVAAGAVAGLAGAAALAGLLKSLLFAIQPIDAPTYLVTTVVLAAVAVAACAMPAFRATRVDPMVALREE